MVTVKVEKREKDPHDPEEQEILERKGKSMVSGIQS